MVHADIVPICSRDMHRMSEKDANFDRFVQRPGDVWLSRRGQRHSGCHYRDAGIRFLSGARCRILLRGLEFLFRHRVSGGDRGSRQRRIRGRVETHRQSFNVWTDATTGAVPTCRFFSTAFAPRSSHFYTPYAAECASLEAGTTWQFESIAFYVQVPDANGVCPGGSIALYRLFNGAGAAPNHRYTTSVATLNQMLALGWSFEGHGTTKVFACVPDGS